MQPIPVKQSSVLKKRSLRKSSAHLWQSTWQAVVPQDVYKRQTKEDAEKTYYAVKDWLWKRLKLEVSDEKSKVTNLRKRDSEFLGFRIKLRCKSNSWVITSNVCDKAIHRIGKEMADSVKAIQSSKTVEEISLNVGDYNAKVIGVQDYYCIATRINLNFSDIARPINGQLLHRIDGIKKQGEIKNRYLRKRYGKSKQMRWIGETPLVPLAYVQFKIPMRKNRKINLYTPEGRAEIHDNLRIDVNSMLWLMTVSYTHLGSRPSLPSPTRKWIWRSNDLWPL